LTKAPVAPWFAGLRRGWMVSEKAGASGRFLSLAVLFGADIASFRGADVPRHDKEGEIAFVALIRSRPGALLMAMAGRRGLAAELPGPGSV
jgi:3-polyprenyl-4-hydroxybenzoate decarboxylase